MLLTDDGRPGEKTEDEEQKHLFFYNFFYNFFLRIKKIKKKKLGEKMNNGNDWRDKETPAWLRLKIFSTIQRNRRTIFNVWEQNCKKSWSENESKV